MNLQKLNPFYFVLYTANQELNSISYRLKNQSPKSEYQLEFQAHPKEFFGWNSFVTKLAEFEIGRVKDFILFHSVEMSENDINKEISILLQIKNKLKMHDVYLHNWIFKLVVRPIHFFINSTLERRVIVTIEEALRVIDIRIFEIEESKKVIQNGKKVLDTNSEENFELTFQKFKDGDIIVKTKFLLEIWNVYLDKVFHNDKNGKTEKLKEIGRILGLPVDDVRVADIIKDANGDFRRGLRERKLKDSFLVYKQFIYFFQAISVKK